MAQLNSTDYWRKWAYQRGYEQAQDRLRHENAQEQAQTVSSDPELRKAFIEGWRDSVLRSPSRARTRNKRHTVI